MSEDLLEWLSTSLEQGLGLSKSATQCGLTPKEVSTLISADPRIREDCLAAVQKGYTNLLALCQQLTQKSRYESWQIKVETLRGFVAQLNLWESVCSVQDVDDDIFMATLMQYRVVDEAATVMGLTRSEFLDYLLDRPYLSDLFAKYGLFLEPTAG